MRIDWKRLEFVEEISKYEEMIAKGITRYRRIPNLKIYVEFLKDELREYDYWQKEARRLKNEKKN